MALLKGKLFAGALFAGALISGQQIVTVPEQPVSVYAKGGGSWQPVSKFKIIKIKPEHYFDVPAYIHTVAPISHFRESLPDLPATNKNKQRSRLARRASEELLLLS